MTAAYANTRDAWATAQENAALAEYADELTAARAMAALGSSTIPEAGSFMLHATERVTDALVRLDAFRAAGQVAAS
ncbi:MAG: hypothetical protein EPO65_00525 [Dehalococcoidia bacterium]|nr:MAG: hypothetical protein EPO65_00525 [Dehalococcoidia bacterium]